MHRSAETERKDASKYDSFFMFVRVHRRLLLVVEYRTNLVLEGEGWPTLTTIDECMHACMHANIWNHVQLQITVENTRRSIIKNQMGSMQRSRCLRFYSIPAHHRHFRSRYGTCTMPREEDWRVASTNDDACHPRVPAPRIPTPSWSSLFIEKTSAPQILSRWLLN